MPPRASRLFFQIDSSVAGTVWTAVPWTAGNYSSPGGWSVTAGQLITHAFAKAANTKTCQVIIEIRASTLTTADANLYINLPPGVVPAYSEVPMPFAYWCTGLPAGQGAAIGVAYATYNVNYIRLNRDVFSTSWPAGGQIYISFNAGFPYL